MNTRPPSSCPPNAPELWAAALPRLADDANKYTRGHVLVLAGGLESVGAARLAARAALRIGAGLVTIGAPREALVAHAARGPDALMVRAVDGEAGLDAILADQRRNALVIGPAYGLGEPTRTAAQRVLRERRACVLDADALTAFAGDAPALAAAIAGEGRVVLTPHAGEFARLFGPIRDKVSDTRAAARFVRAVVVHKGPDTVVAAPDGRAVVNTNGVPTLATAGSGDVLAGIVAGLLAQGMPPFEAAAAAVHIHAETARAFGAGLIADDLADRVRCPVPVAPSN